MSEQTIQSEDIKIADVFQAFYVVPDYQREYVWQAEQVEQLLTDIYAELSGSNPSDAPEYFIGSIVVCPGYNGVMDLIDGQQRMTTLFLVLCSIRDRLVMLGSNPPGALQPQIAATYTNALGVDEYRYRLDLQYEDSGEVLVQIAKGEAVAQDDDTRSIKNILDAYSTATAFFTQQFGGSVEQLKTFYGYLINKVKLIRIQTEDVAKALKIFETINDRGVGLDSMDLLKNLLFMKADRSQFEKLKSLWKKLQDTIYDAREKPLRFLRYFIFSRYDVDVLREDQIYSWFSKNAGLCGYPTNPVGFANELLQGASAYGQFLNGCDEEGKKRPRLESMNLLGGSAARQHHILLLAGRHLPELLFDRLVFEVENLFFVYIITREPTRNFERGFARWAQDLRKVNSEADLTAFINRWFVPSKKELAARFADAIGRLGSDSLQQYRLRYVLAKLTQHVEIKAYGETEGTRWLSHYTSNEYEIEHIYPDNPDLRCQHEFGTPTDPDVAQRLGNLVLIEKSINASFGNKAFSIKRDLYQRSKLLLTQSITAPLKVGVDTKIDRAVKNLKSFCIWNETEIGVRQQMVAGLASEIWQI